MTRRPRWGRLYAILPLGIAAFVLVELLRLPPALRPVLEYGIGAVVWGAIIWWVRANRVAIAQREWCACASRAVIVREITPRPRRLPREQPAAQPRSARLRA